MHNYNYSICGCSFRLLCSQPIEKSKRYSLFAVSEQENPPTYQLMITPTDCLPLPVGEPEYCAPLRTYYNKGKQVYTAYADAALLQKRNYACKTDDSCLYIRPVGELRESAVFDGLDLPTMLLKKDIGILHCSYVEYQGGALLFAGHKQVGKSTQAALWQKHLGAQVINGDRAGVYQEDDTFYADGIPYCGTSNICINKKLPIRAIVCPIKGVDNQLTKLSNIDAFKELLGKFTYVHRTEDTERILTLVTRLTQSIPVYRFVCTKSFSAVDYLHKEIFE